MGVRIVKGGGRQGEPQLAASMRLTGALGLTGIARPLSVRDENEFKY
jgi:hypothetical protein